ncbi:MAG: flagellar biosynthetic protein FliO [Thermodesulfobacteriota bacterium]|nr:flagellar biosynthetic protein FliO [Thermodesulfobacteriota bacterium]
MTNEADLISTSLRMLAALAIVMAALILLYYFVKRRFSAENGRAKGNLIRVIANTYIGLKKNISLVEVPGAILVVGVTNDRISLLSKIEDKEILENLGTHEDGRVLTSFSDHLQKLSSKLRKDGDKP